MKLLSLLIFLLLICVGAAVAAPESHQAVTAKGQGVTELWLTVRFDRDLAFSRPFGDTPPLKTKPPYAEVGTLVTIGTDFWQQFSCPSGQYSIAGVVDNPTDGKYPLSIRLTGGTMEWGGMTVKLALDTPYSTGIVSGIVRGAYTITLSHAPAWADHTRPPHWTPPTVAAPTTAFQTMMGKQPLR